MRSLSALRPVRAILDASPYLKDATTYTVQVEAQAGYDGGTLMKTVTARIDGGYGTKYHLFGWERTC